MSDQSHNPILPAPFSLCRYDSIGSTSDEAKRLAQEGAAHGTIVWALEQQAGRGRMDRQWSSPRGNLFMSLIWRPDIPAATAAGIGFVAALAVADTLAALLPADVTVMLKWPNDVLIKGGKAAGILVEASISASGALDWLVLGIGINLAAAPTAALYPTAALADFMPAPGPASVLERLVEALGSRLGTWQRSGFGAIRRDWLARAHAPGTILTVRQSGETLNGCFVDLDADGTLILAIDAGQARIAAGDVHLPTL